MKVTALVVFSIGLFLTACGHLDTTPPAAADRILTGVVTNNTGGGGLPSDTEVTVRVMDLSKGDGHGEVLGEETIMNPSRMPVAFRVAYRAEDLALMGNVAVEARISVGGKLRYVTAGAHPITLGNVNDSHVIEVELAAKR